MRLYVDDLRISPYTYTVHVALREKGIAFEVHEARFARGRAVDPGFAGKTFTDLIPALEDGPLLLSESLAILEYLEEKFPAPERRSLFPRAIEDRARARMLLSWYRCGLQALRAERSTETVFYNAELRAREPLSAQAREEVEDWLRALRAWLKPGSDALFGEWSIADTETALMLHRLILNGDPIDAELDRYARAVWRRPAEAEWVGFRRRPFASYYA